MPKFSNQVLGFTSDRLIRRRDVEALTGLSCSSIYRFMDRGDFPRPRKIGSGPTGAVAWRLRDIEQWMESLAVADLHELLSEAAQANDPDCFVLDHAFTAYHKTDAGIEISFANGNTATCDVVVGADGIRSIVREAMFGPEDPKFTGNVAYRGLVNKGDLSDDVVTPASGVAIAPRKAFTRYLVRDGGMINFVAFVRREGWNEEGWSIPATTEELLEEFGDWHPRIRALIEAAPKDKVFKWALYDRDPLEQWTKDRVTLLGDAAHPMLPFMGMGAAMGIEDGVVLGRAFGASNSIDEALQRYEDARKERANFVLLRSRAARERLQSDHPEQYDDSKHQNEESLGLFDYNPGTVPV